jgi:hypothetical protein
MDLDINNYSYGDLLNVFKISNDDSLENIEKMNKNPLSVFETAIANASPKMEVRPRRVGGASYQVPTEVRGDRRESLAIRWLVDAARSRTNSQFHHFSEKYPIKFFPRRSQGLRRTTARFQV